MRKQLFTFDFNTQAGLDTNKVNEEVKLFSSEDMITALCKIKDFKNSFLQN